MRLRTLRPRHALLPAVAVLALLAVPGLAAASDEVSSASSPSDSSTATTNSPQAAPASLGSATPGSSATAGGGTSSAAQAPSAASPAPQPLSLAAVGTASRSTSGNSSLVTPITQPVAASSTVVVAVGSGTFAGTVGCTDSEGNQYTVVGDRNTGNGRVFVCAAAVTTRLNGGDAVTATYPGFSGLSLSSVSVVTGLATPGTSSGVSSSSGSNPPITSGALIVSEVPSLVFGVVGHTGTSAFAAAADLETLADVSAGTGSGRKTLTTVYRTLDAPGDQAVTGSLSGSGFWQAVANSYRVATSVGSPSPSFSPTPTGWPPATSTGTPLQSTAAQPAQPSATAIQTTTPSQITP